MRIAVDIDGVLAGFQPGWVHAYNGWFGAKVDPSEARQWDSFMDLTHFGHPDDFWLWTDQVPQFWSTLPVIPGAMAGVEELTRLGHELVLVTNRHENTRAQTAEWVARRWPVGTRVPIIHHTKDKASVPCQLYVDDSPEVLEQLCAAGLPCVKFRQPWNLGSRCSAGAVDRWSDLVVLVGSLAEAIA